jgi:hypothetical protein
MLRVSAAIRYAEPTRKDAAIMAAHDDRHSAAAKNLADARKQALADRPEAMPSLRMLMQRDRDTLTDRELVSRCAAAARITASAHKPDDVEDVAATLAARFCASIGHAIDAAPNVSKLCGEALNLYRAIDRQRVREVADGKTADAEYALTPAALGIKSAEDRHFEACERIASVTHAEIVATDLLRRFSDASTLPAPPNAYLALVGALADIDAPTLARHYGAEPAAIRKRMQRGRDQLRAIISATDLLRAVLAIAREDERSTVARHSRKLLAQDARATQPVETEVTERMTEARAINCATDAIDRHELRRAAYRWIRAEYAARLRSVGRASDIAHAQDRRAAKRTSSASTLASGLVNGYDVAA